ncbi:MAG: VWA domain-containing protein, partial [Candidatus Eremiobacteraeota bacterium]|nr:VWA domain-containing protein [Candidatus Eremiobacteraeota bacterium]
MIFTSGGRVLAPEKVQLQAHCTGPAARVVVALQFPGGDGSQAAFVYPIPAQVAVARFEAALGIRRYEGKVTTREAEGTIAFADTRYVHEMLADAQFPVLTVALGTVKGSDKAHVLLEYCIPIEPQGGHYYLRFPICLDPRFGVDTASINYKVDVLLESGGLLLEPPVATHPITVRRLENEDSHVTLTGSSVPDGDFVLRYRLGIAEMPKTWMRTNGQYFLFGIFPPTSMPDSPQRRDLVFVVDASENMTGELFSAVSEGVSEVLRSLRNNDRFSLVTIGRSIDGYQGGDFYEIEEAEEAVQWLQRVRPAGRADILPLLERILTLPVKEGRQLCVFLIAAGHVGNEPTILKSLEFDQSDR